MKPKDIKISCDESAAGPMPGIADCGRLSYAIFQTAKHHRALAGDLLRPLNLCPGQEILLMRLCDKAQQTQTQLLECLKVEPSTVTKAVQRLQAQGLVKRVPSATDGRSHLIQLTDEGRELKKRIVKMWSELDRVTSENLTPDEYQTLCNLLEKVSANVATRGESHS
ncbi:MAG: MarR family winged helix-turn-helix transcriptional regulator [Bdellovibrionota bacterium]